MTNWVEKINAGQEMNEQYGGEDGFCTFVVKQLLIHAYMPNVNKMLFQAIANAAIRNPTKICAVISFVDLNEDMLAHQELFEEYAFSDVENEFPGYDSYLNIFKADGTDGEAVFAYLALDCIRAHCESSFGRSSFDSIPSYIRQNCGEDIDIDFTGWDIQNFEELFNRADWDAAWETILTELCEYADESGFPEVHTFQHLSDVEERIMAPEVYERFAGQIEWPYGGGVLLFW